MGSVVRSSTRSFRLVRAARRPILALSVCALVVASCGTRLPDEAFVEAGQTGTGERASGLSDDGTTPDVVGGTDTVTDTGTVADGATDDSQADGGTGPAVDGGTDGTAVVDAGGGGGTEANTASDVGVTETTIKIGNITAENGVLGDTFAPAVRGLRAWVLATNAAGGINGRQVEIATCDDREDRARALECARRLVEQDKVFALVAVNSRSIGGAAQYLADQNVPVIGFPISNSFYRYPNFFTIYTAGAGYPRDGKSVGFGGEIVNSSAQWRWYRDNLGVKKAGVVYYDIDASAQQGEAFAKAMEAEGYEVSRYPVSFAAPSFDQAVADMQSKGVELIADAMDDGANRRLCDSIQRRKFTPKAKVSTVVVMGQSVGDNYNDSCRDIIYVTNDSHPYTSNQPEVAEFRKAYAQFQPGLPLHQWALEGWAQGNVARSAIESMGAAPTRKGFIDFLNTSEPLTGDGILIGTDYRKASYDYGAPTQDACFTIARFQASTGWASASKVPVCYPDAKNIRAKALEQGN